MQLNLEGLRECCQNEKIYLVIYDGGPTSDLPILVCQSCFETRRVFQKFIKEKMILTETDLDVLRLDCKT